MDASSKSERIRMKFSERKSFFQNLRSMYGLKILVYSCFLSDRLTSRLFWIRYTEALDTFYASDVSNSIYWSCCNEQILNSWIYPNFRFMNIAQTNTSNIVLLLESTIFRLIFGAMPCFISSTRPIWGATLAPIFIRISMWNNGFLISHTSQYDQ